MNKRITLTEDDMALITLALNDLTYGGNSMAIRQRIKQITDKFGLEQQEGE